MSSPTPAHTAGDRARDAAARSLVAGSLWLLGYGTLEGSAPSWPSPETYAALAVFTGLLWLLTAVIDDDRVDRLASASLMALALMRGGGYVWDWLANPSDTNIAAIGAWGITAGLLLIRPSPVPSAADVR